MAKIRIGDLYALAKTSGNYGDFMAILGKYVGIPPTCSRVMDITLEDLCNENIENK